MKFSSPELLGDLHDVGHFACGESQLDDWLRLRAFDNLTNLASTTYVVCPEEKVNVAGFYALAMGQVISTDVTARVRRNMPQIIPAVVLGRLAVDQSFQGNGLGALLLRDAIVRSHRVAKEIAGRLIVVHAISASAEAFYLHNGFERLKSPTPTFALDLVRLPQSLLED